MSNDEIRMTKEARNPNDESRGVSPLLSIIRHYFMKPRPMAVRRWEALPIRRAFLRRMNKLSFREGPEGQEGELKCTSGKANPT